MIKFPLKIKYIGPHPPKNLYYNVKSIKLISLNMSSTIGDYNNEYIIILIYHYEDKNIPMNNKYYAASI